MNYCPSQDWDRYCNENDVFEGCPVCQSDHKTWIEVEKSDPKYEELNDPYRCKNCGVYHDFAMEYFNKFIEVLAPEPELDPEPDPFFTQEELDELEEAAQKSFIARLTEAGFLDENGEPTDVYYCEGDFQYDCARERR